MALGPHSSTVQARGPPLALDPEIALELETKLELDRLELELETTLELETKLELDRLELELDRLELDRELELLPDPLSIPALV